MKPISLQEATNLGHKTNLSIFPDIPYEPIPPEQLYAMTADRLFLLNHLASEHPYFCVIARVSNVLMHEGATKASFRCIDHTGTAYRGFITEGAEWCCTHFVKETGSVVETNIDDPTVNFAAPFGKTS